MLESRLADIFSNLILLFSINKTGARYSEIYDLGRISCLSEVSIIRERYRPARTATAERQGMTPGTKGESWSESAGKESGHGRDARVCQWPPR